MIEFRTKFDGEVANSLSKWQFKKLGWILLLISIVFCGIGLIFIFVVEDESEYPFAVVMIVFGLIFAPLMWLLSRNSQKQINKSASLISNETEQIYQFFDDKVIVYQSKGEDFKSTAEIKYNCFFKVIETPTHYFLYISHAQAHVIVKNHLVEGNLEELNHILSNNLRGKFKPLKKN